MIHHRELFFILFVEKLLILGLVEPMNVTNAGLLIGWDI